MNITKKNPINLQINTKKWGSKQINIADDSSEQLSECGETKLQTNRRGAMSRGNKNNF